MNEYSYFQAKGRSLLIVQIIDEAVADLVQFKKDLCTRYKASRYHDWGDKAPELGYHPHSKIPAGFITREQMGPDYETGGSKVEWIFAWPAPNTPEAEYAEGVKKLMNRAYERSQVGNMFGFPAKIKKERAAGRYHTSFVRQGDLEEGNRAGRVYDSTLRSSYSSSPSILEGCPIHFQKIDGAWYIRVWNDADGKPLFVPPDAEEIPFDEMLKVDEREMAKRFLVNPSSAVVKKPKWP